MNGRNFQRQYKNTLSGYNEWNQKEHAESYVVYPKNIGYYLSIDETALSNGELYTIVTNKAKKGKKGSIVGIFEGTQAGNIIKLIKEKFTEQQRRMVKEVTLDMANSMNLIVEKCFPKAIRVVDRFHVQKLACDGVQERRIHHRWEAIKQDNEDYKEAKKKGIKHIPATFENGDTLKQLLVRSRYLLFKPSHKWTESQQKRANILFNVYPDIEQAYDLSHHLYLIYSRNMSKPVAMTHLAQWFNQIELADIDSFQIIKRTFENHYQNIINFFDNRSTNAAAESFNAKIKDFRRQFRGVVDVKFFLFRLTKIFA